MTLHLAPCPRCYGIECPCDERPDPLVTAAVEKRHRDAREAAVQAPDVAALLLRLDELERSGEHPLDQRLTVEEIRALLGTDTTPDSHT